MHTRSVLTFLVFMLVSLSAVAGPCLSVCKDGRTYVYRGDSRPPEVVFAEGFRPRGANPDLQAYLSGRLTETAYVGTSRDMGRATVYAAQAAHATDDNPATAVEHPRGYVYEIEVPANESGEGGNIWVDVVARYPRDAAVQRNQEIAHLGGIAPSLIRRAFAVTLNPASNEIRRDQAAFFNPAWSTQRGNATVAAIEVDTMPTVAAASGAPFTTSCGASRSERAADPAGTDASKDYCQARPKTVIKQMPWCTGSTKGICAALILSPSSAQEPSVETPERNEL
jgi:Pertussis toxin, subunit 1